ncbi:hypothetical protein QBC47DRAFT_139342 [Echria macrotheca]|uniref:Uncharacterized protein n=1 Tax=Echria macrotheca TaxID=438768 RepID=A0AAJ0BHL7_9PEZI|nr:hypothetical protein QBC47DRAFT_139342 [Echria macrotheca]
MIGGCCPFRERKLCLLLLNCRNLPLLQAFPTSPRGQFLTIRPKQLPNPFEKPALCQRVPKKTPPSLPEISELCPSRYATKPIPPTNSIPPNQPLVSSSKKNPFRLSDFHCPPTSSTPAATKETRREANIPKTSGDQLCCNRNCTPLKPHWPPASRDPGIVLCR